MSGPARKASSAATGEHPLDYPSDAPRAVISEQVPLNHMP
jgi:hypothetical protein